MLQPLLIILFISSLYSQCDGFSQSNVTIMDCVIGLKNYRQ